MRRNRVNLHRKYDYPVIALKTRGTPTPNDFPRLEAVAERLANFERYFESIAHPFEWKFTRTDLNARIARMRVRWAQSQPLKLAA